MSIRKVGIITAAVAAGSISCENPNELTPPSSTDKEFAVSGAYADLGLHADPDSVYVRFGAVSDGPDGATTTLEITLTDGADVHTYRASGRPASIDDSLAVSRDRSDREVNVAYKATSNGQSVNCADKSVVVPAIVDNPPVIEAFAVDTGNYCYSGCRYASFSIIDDRGLDELFFDPDDGSPVVVVDLVGVTGAYGAFMHTYDEDGVVRHPNIKVTDTAGQSAADTVEVCVGDASSSRY